MKNRSDLLALAYCLRDYNFNESSVNAAGQSPDDTPVYLNVYDLTPMNGYFMVLNMHLEHTTTPQVEYLKWNLVNVLVPFATAFCQNHSRSPQSAMIQTVALKIARKGG
ncbi:hypothetical protein E2562_027814 [Oryza meyeriana var. granulata]|uniref:Uncharacterized protein n=1 Tax=Oryza meyeriana var. granulata TaxID=110450 RepID=A0A6G1DP18_9ORYZ|nr:hypothetical protein E2562_027814 [Oryza meyeriana var. granulata]